VAIGPRSKGCDHQQQSNAKRFFNVTVKPPFFCAYLWRKAYYRATEAMQGETYFALRLPPFFCSGLPPGMWEFSPAPQNEDLLAACHKLRQSWPECERLPAQHLNAASLITPPRWLRSQEHKEAALFQQVAMASSSN